jgi:hypothetical protein
MKKLGFLLAARTAIIDGAAYEIVSCLHFFTSNAANKTKSDLMSHAAESSSQRL